MNDFELSVEALIAQGTGLNKAQNTDTTPIILSAEGYDGWDDQLRMDLENSLESINLINTFSTIDEKNVSDKVRMLNKLYHNYGSAHVFNDEAARAIESLCIAEMSTEADKSESVGTKIKGVIKRVWEAIKLACQRVCTAIMNFLKWISNKIGSLAVKSQDRDYRFYKEHRAIIMSNWRNAAKTGAATVNVLDWVPASGIESMLKQFTKVYGTVCKQAEKEKNVVSVIADADMSDVGFFKKLSAFSTAKGYSSAAHDQPWIGKQTTTGGMAVSFKVFTDQIDKDRKAFINNIFGVSFDKDINAGQNVHHMVLSRFTKSNSDKRVDRNVMEIAKATGDFAVLSADWMKTHITGTIASAREALKKFNEYTKLIEKISSNFAKVADRTNKHLGEISKGSADMVRARIKFNALAQSLCLEIESCALRYRADVHKACKKAISCVKRNTSELTSDVKKYNGIVQRGKPTPEPNKKPSWMTA